MSWKSLGNLVLYAKNGYKKTNDIFSDVLLCLRADELQYIKQDPQYIAEFVGRKVRPFMAECRMDEFLRNMSPNYCRNIGYNFEMMKDYNYWEAVLRAYLYELLMMELSELGIELPKPSDSPYVKELLF